jgi:hypothetical protein
MQYPDYELGRRGYESAHVSAVAAAVRTGFPKYFGTFFSSPTEVKLKFLSAIKGWEQDYEAYQKFLDIEFLEEFDVNPAAFKNAMKTKCPIIRHCLNSSMQEMKKYKIEFNTAMGQDLLTVVTNIARFGEQYMETFDDAAHERAATVDALGLSPLVGEGYTAYGVIGGGIKSRFLYALYPEAFADRNQEGIWALYFLTDAHHFGFHDGSEFIMARMDHDKNTIQQNYHYPYDLFAWYALLIYTLLREACAEKKVPLDPQYRYIYVLTFLNHVAEQHHDDIRLLKGTNEYDYYG